MNILIAGGSGFVGKKLRNNAIRKGHTIRLIAREDYLNKDSLNDKIQWSTVIINLAGVSISKRWTKSNKTEIYKSRINTTKAIVEGIQAAQRKPKLLISVSAIGIYSNSKIQTEDDNLEADDFLAQVCKDWEIVAQRASNDTRVVIFRMGVILGRNGGIVKQLSTLFKLGLGAKLGSGEQMMSWVHIDDVVNAFLYALKNQQMAGIYNLTAPIPVSNSEFTKAFAKAMHRKAWFTIPAFVLRIIYGEQASMFLDEKYVLPKRLLEADFNFRNDTIQAAFKQIFRKKEPIKNLENQQKESVEKAEKQPA
jgi:hypothetical protein